MGTYDKGLRLCPHPGEQLGLQGPGAGGGDKQSSWEGKEGVGLRRGRGRGGEERRGLPSSGPACTEEVTACHSGLCLNGGSCSPRPGGHLCTCPPSHTGPRCESSSDLCASGECHGVLQLGTSRQGTCAIAKTWRVSWCSDGVGGWPVCGVTEVTSLVIGKKPNPWLTASSLQPRASTGVPV